MISMQADMFSFTQIQYRYSRGSGMEPGRICSTKSSGLKPAGDKLTLFMSHVKIDARQNFDNQNAMFHFNNLSREDKSRLFYKDTPVSMLSRDEAEALTGPDGYFGISRTSRRIIDFVIMGAKDDPERLKVGREGVLRGFTKAKKAWGGALPDICCKTIDESIKAIDERILELGGNIVGMTA